MTSLVLEAMNDVATKGHVAMVMAPFVPLGKNKPSVALFMPYTMASTCRIRATSTQLTLVQVLRLDRGRQAG
jgi:hypothetical protein